MYTFLEGGQFEHSFFCQFLNKGKFFQREITLINPTVLFVLFM